VLGAVGEVDVLSVGAVGCDFWAPPKRRWSNSAASSRPPRPNARASAKHSAPNTNEKAMVTNFSAMPRCWMAGDRKPAWRRIPEVGCRMLGYSLPKSFLDIFAFRVEFH
jgi:hypothetical protein